MIHNVLFREAVQFPEIDERHPPDAFNYENHNRVLSVLHATTYRPLLPSVQYVHSLKRKSERVNTRIHVHEK